MQQGSCNGYICGYPFDGDKNTDSQYAFIDKRA